MCPTHMRTYRSFHQKTNDEQRLEYMYVLYGITIKTM